MPAPAYKGVGADIDPLMNQHIAGKNRPVSHRHVTGQGGIVHQNGVVPQHAVVAHVHIGHEQVVVADGGLTPVLYGTAVDRHPLPDGVVVADHQPGGLAPILEVRRVLPHGGELENPVAATDAGGAPDDHMGVDHGPVADNHIRPHHGPGADADVIADFRRRVDTGAGVDQSHSP